MKILNLNERLQVIMISIAIVIIGIFIFNKTTNILLNDINKSYIKQNIGLVGKLSKIEGVNIEEIIEIFTKGDKGEYEQGKKVLETYSYNEHLEYAFNPIFENKISIIKLIVLLYVILSAILFSFMFTKIQILINCIKRLKLKAELILEGRDIEINEEKFMANSVEELEVQFMTMKCRMDASVERLKIEKLNLKNIISDISHQLKTPLAAMGIYNQILLAHNEMEEKEINNFIELSNGQVRRIEFLVKSLLKYARIDNDVVKYKKVKQSINDTVKEAISLLKAKANEKNINITVIENENIDLLHDRVWVSEALMNIIKNAIEHTEKNGKIKVRIIKSEIFIRIEIEDNGKGIEQKDISRIFERFHKGSNNLNPESIGIGLALSKKIIEANNASISVRSKIGQGSKFIITFIK